jgi:hypothetical protein
MTASTVEQCGYNMRAPHSVAEREKSTLNIEPKLNQITLLFCKNKKQRKNIS